MARKRKRARRKSDDTWPGWVWMLFGLAIGLSVAAAIWFRDVSAPVVEASRPAEQQPPPVVEVPALDRNSETFDDEPEEEERFAFYELLKKMEVQADFAAPQSRSDRTDNAGEALVAVDVAGTYMIQAGSFSLRDDAERRRGELGFLGIESHIVRAQPSGVVRFRVYIGPISDLDRLNLVRRQLREAGIDALRITID